MSQVPPTCKKVLLVRQTVRLMSLNAVLRYSRLRPRALYLVGKPLPAFLLLLVLSAPVPFLFPVMRDTLFFPPSRTFGSLDINPFSITVVHFLNSE